MGLLDDFLTQNQDQGGPPPTQSAAPMAPPPSAPDEPNATTQVGELQVTAPPKPVQKYDNTKDVQAMQAAQGANPPKGGSDNPGIWGLLPENMQHGTFRNILGALGDAFLVQSGHQPTYAPRMQRQEVANAMQGYENNPKAAIERVFGTAAPGSAELGEKMQSQYENQQLRMAQQDATEQYRQANTDLRRDNNASLAQNRTEGQLRMIAPQVGAWLQAAKTSQEYATAYARGQSALGRIGKDVSMNDIGAIDPKDWQPGADVNVGQTANSVARTASQDTRAGAERKIQQQNADTNTYRAHHPNYRPQQVTNAATIDSIRQKVNAGQALSAGDQAVWDKATKVKGGAGSTLHAATTAGGPAPAAPSGAVEYLKKNPGQRAAFDAKYGPGASAKILGR